MILARIRAGLRRHPFRWLVEAAVVYAALWTILEPAFAFLGMPPQGSLRYWLLVMASLLIGLFRALPPRSVTRRLPGSNTSLTIQFRDLFETPGVRVIPVNEFFDSALGAHVSPQSLHGQLINREFGGHPDVFDRQVTQELANLSSEKIERPSGKVSKYPVGTTAGLTVGDRRYLAFVLCRTELQTNKAYANVADLWTAMIGLWKRAREVAGGAPLVVPLIGGGLSGIGLPPQHLLTIIIISILDTTKRERIAGDITILLPDALFADVDLSAAINLAQ